jgi:uncharacterized protein (UPF0262 family)
VSQGRLVAVELDEEGLPPPSAETEQERRVAIFDLLEANAFAPPDAPPGPYRLRLALRGGRLRFAVATEAGAPVAGFELSLAPLQQVVKDYFQICESYFDAVRRLPPAEIEALDHGRRAIHDEGSRLLLERLEGKVATDMATARRLFTLVCALHPAG